MSTWLKLDPQHQNILGVNTKKMIKYIQFTTLTNSCRAKVF